MTASVPDGGGRTRPQQEMPSEMIQRILKDRARALAKPLEQPGGAVAETRELLVFSLATERYGIDAAHVLEVSPFRELTPVPCTPPFVLGVTSHRGRVLPVLDLQRLLDLASRGVTEGGRVVAVEAGGMAFGLFAESVLGTHRISDRQVTRALAVFTSDRHPFVRGVTDEMVTVLDLDTLAGDRRIVVNDEVG